MVPGGISHVRYIEGGNVRPYTWSENVMDKSKWYLESCEVESEHDKLLTTVDDIDFEDMSHQVFGRCILGR